MPWIKVAPFPLPTAAEEPLFCEFPSQPHKGPESTHQEPCQLQLMHTEHSAINRAECAIKTTL